MILEFNAKHFLFHNCVNAQIDEHIISFGDRYFLWCKNNLLDWPCFSMNICKNFQITFLPLSVWAHEYKKEGVDADKIIGI